MTPNTAMSVVVDCNLNNVEVVAIINMNINCNDSSLSSRQHPRFVLDRPEIGFAIESINGRYELLIATQRLRFWPGSVYIRATVEWTRRTHFDL
jgi:hypothetical protein